MHQTYWALDVNRSVVKGSQFDEVIRHVKITLSIDFAGKTFWQSLAQAKFQSLEENTFSPTDKGRKEKPGRQATMKRYQGDRAFIQKSAASS
jgi:hypothetical protein